MKSLTNPLDDISTSYFNAKFNEAKTIGDLKPENPFHKDFKIIKLLGEGAFGKVYLAKSQINDVERAIKIISKDNYEGKTYEREFKILKELNHPNILKYAGSYDYKNKVYLVTEYCNGKELLNEIIKNCRLTEKEAQNYFREISEALCYLHSKNVVHRDLKPENIIIEKKTKLVKLIDFGLSKKKFKKTTKIRSEVGTVMYSSPEVDAGYYSEKCDVWSMGVILYLTLRGQLPFYADTTKKLIKIKKSYSPEFKGYKWDRISKNAKDFISKCLCKKEKERMSAIEALNHPWLREEANDEVILDQKLVNQLYTYSRECRLINNIKYFICAFNELHKKEKDIVNLFKRIDTDKNGEISKEELFHAFETNIEIFQMFKITRHQIELLFNQLDLDCSGSIDYIEFIVAIKNFASGFTRKTLKNAFDELSGEDGYLNLKSLSKTLGTALPENEWLSILDRYDKDNNGKIDFEEFLTIFKVNV